MVKLSNVKIKKINNYSIPGLKKLNSLIGGVNENEVITIGARVGCGKTSLALNLLSRFSRQGKCLFVSLEMDAMSIVQRIRKSGLKTNFENIYYLDVGNIEEIEKFIEDYGIKFLFIDYLQLMNCSIQKVSRLIKLLTLKHHLITFQLSQLNRYASTNRPTMEMLSQSDKIAHDSDQVGLITQDYINVVKNRKGKTGVIDTSFQKEKFLFVETKIPFGDRNTIIRECNSLAKKGLFEDLENYINDMYKYSIIDDEFKEELMSGCKKEKKSFYKQGGIGGIINKMLRR